MEQDKCQCNLPFGPSLPSSRYLFAIVISQEFLAKIIILINLFLKEGANS